MKKTVLAIAFAVASIPMFAAQTQPPANPPASGSTQKAEAPKTKKHAKKAVKKATPKKEGTASNASGSTAAKPVSK